SISSAKDNINSDVIFRINSNSLSVFGLSKGERVSIYDTTGRLITTAISTKDNETLNLSLKTSNGIYIARTKSGISFKFTL
ncbi:MAG: T9SS sorting signal type C domain-containing protein, partial [Prevotella pallens]|nr:T9SS sorting signal type C domain-containing protein [Prevotella pallens]